MKGKNTYEDYQTSPPGSLLITVGTGSVYALWLLPYRQLRCRRSTQSELDQLKNLDSDTTQKYISYTEMFPDATENTKLSDEIQNVFSLFFQQFDYKILDVSVDEDKKNAQASLELTTIDAKSLATDFAAELLRTKITEAAQAKQEILKIPPNLWKVII